jgi:uncharacterized protein YqeY
MSELFAQIKSKRIQAMKDKNEVAKAFLSVMMGEVEKEAKSVLTEPTDAMVVAVAKKMAKNIQDNINVYTKGGVDHSREDLEMSLVSPFLPKTLSEPQTREAVKAIFEKNPVKWGESTGPLMGIIKKELGNTVDMKLVSQIVKELVA